MGASSCTGEVNNRLRGNQKLAPMGRSYRLRMIYKNRNAVIPPAWLHSTRKLHSR